MRAAAIAPTETEPSVQEKETLCVTPPTVVDDVKHNLSNAFVCFSLAATSVSLFYFVHLFLLELYKWFPNEQYAVTWLTINSMFGVVQSGMIFTYVKLKPSALWKAVLAFGTSFYLGKAIVIALYVWLTNRPLNLYVLLIDFVTLLFSYLFMFSLVASQSFGKIFTLSFNLSLNIVQAAVFASLYIYAVESMQNELLRFFLISVLYPSIAVTSIRIFTLNLTKLIIKLTNHTFADGVVRMAYNCFKLVFTIPCYYVVISVDSDSIFVVAVLANIGIEIAMTWIECIFFMGIEKFVEELLIKILLANGVKVPPSIVSTTENSTLKQQSNTSDATKHALAVKKARLSELLMYEEFVEALSVLLCAVAYYTTDHLDPLVITIRLIFMYATNFGNDLIQKRIFSLNGFYLSAHEIKLSYAELFILTVESLIVCCYVPLSHAFLREQA